MVFLAFVAVFYLFDAVWDVMRDKGVEKLFKFGWLCLGVVAAKVLVKFATWAINL